MQIRPVKPPHVRGRFAGINVPDHAQQIIRIEGKNVEGKDVQAQCYEKRDYGEDQERKMAKAEANSPDMEPPTLTEGRNGFEHVWLPDAFLPKSITKSKRSFKIVMCYGGN